MCSCIYIYIYIYTVYMFPNRVCSFVNELLRETHHCPKQKGICLYKDM